MNDGVLVAEKSWMSPVALGRKTQLMFQKSQKGVAFLIHLQMLGFQEASSGAAGGQNSSCDKMRMGLWNRSHHTLEMVLQPKDHEMMLLSGLQISPALDTCSACLLKILLMGNASKAVLATRNSKR